MQNLKVSIEQGLRERMGSLRMRKESREALIQDILEFILILIKDRSAGKVNVDNQAVIMTPDASAAVDKMRIDKLHKPQNI